MDFVLGSRFLDTVWWLQGGPGRCLLISELLSRCFGAAGGAVDAPGLWGYSQRTRSSPSRRLRPGQRGTRRSEQRAGCTAPARAARPRLLPEAEPGAQRPALGKPPRAAPAHRSCHCGGQCRSPSLSHPQRCGRLQELRLCYCLSNRPFLLGEWRGACGRSRARIILIRALFPQRSRAQIRVNPNKIGSWRNGTL